MANYTYTQNDITFPNVAITKNKQRYENKDFCSFCSYDAARGYNCDGAE
jgi:hypothetical protein